MGRFNLLDEAWISVIIDESGKTKEVSLKKLFQEAHLFLDLAGDTKTQDFAVMRIILAVLHTVFSRFNADGKEYGYFEIDEKFNQLEKIENDDLSYYINDLYETWFKLWENKCFPQIVLDYLDKWYDRFYLFDEEYPFMQVVKDDILPTKLSKENASELSGKNINRLISESGNKTSLFSPKYESNSNKEILSESEIARWLITFQGYASLSDKVIFGNEKYKSSKGWLFDLGGIYLKGNNLFETLLLNFVLVHNENKNNENIQNPCWELSSNKVLKSHFKSDVDNISSLYTAWSRGIYIDPTIDANDAFSCGIVKLPDINHVENFLEPMTMWKNNESGDNKGKLTPKKHQKNKSLWRTFGLITINDYSNKLRKPRVLEWFDEIQSISKKRKINFISNPMIIGVSMQDDGNATSWVPIDEILDSFTIDGYVLSDLKDDGWIIKVNEIIEKTKKIIDVVYKRYILDIKEIRNISQDSFVDKKIEDLYFKIDLPFRRWISSIKYGDFKEQKTSEWFVKLYSMVKDEAENIIKNGTMRDYLGIEKEGDFANIAIIFNKFMYFLNNELIYKEYKSGGK